jgi:hypothetical protein
MAGKLKNGWISVKEFLPRSRMGRDALGIPVLIWPRNSGQSEADGAAYFGRRATGKLAFYKYGVEIHGVEAWQYLPRGPKGESE